ncbi:Ig-like domain-containing protein [Streptomyces sp. NPDC001941]|uniref:L,D-transpeptidase family protein n=1 Tax=Streptomyces sp. NPDC001941 TaxID=3154659 RepID=UPI003324B9F3
MRGIRTLAPTLTAAATAGTLLLAGCAGAGGDPASQGHGPEGPQVTVTPAAGSGDAPLGAPVKAAVQGGTLLSVAVKDGDGAALPGHLTGGGTGWVSDRDVRPGTTYRVTSTATAGRGGGGADGKKSFTASFTTRKAPRTNKLTNAPAGGSTVGTGMPVSILFDHPVDKARRAAVEKTLKVTTKPRVEGSWGWVKDYGGKDRIDWRPKDPWPAGTKVSVRGALGGLDSGAGGWFARDYDFDFTIGPDHKGVIDVPGHTLTLYDGDKKVDTLKGSAGSQETPTRGGVHTVRSKNASETMDSATIGYGNQWSLPSKWVTHLTASGTFLHSAPWNKQLGTANNSHGCFGMTEADAKTAYDFLLIGSTVEVKGSSSTEKTDVGNGLEDWQESWAQWKRRSALT